MIRAVWTRFYSKVGLRTPRVNAARDSIHPTTPARTRFAPSPTGSLHFGSLRTALYNYLLAKNTGGQFLLRIEDTDRTRLVPHAESDILQTLEWCGLTFDEGPFRQSDRTAIYQKYAQQLIDSGHAYHCYCLKERNDQLRESAKQLKPQTNVTYDRKCLHDPEVNPKKVVRFKSPDRYEHVHDLLHGELDLQAQYNDHDRRYDDIVLLKSDGLPTYHLANVVDDHLMNITHVIRGEEWLTSTPKHVALYRAFGWEPPKFVHLPLLTTTKDKKLSKRNDDNSVLSWKTVHGILPEAVVNFVALFGWAPRRLEHGVTASELMTLDDLVKSFSLDNLTKGNAKVSESKLYHFNKLHLQKFYKDDEKLTQYVKNLLPEIEQYFGKSLDSSYIVDVFKVIGPTHTIVDGTYLYKHHSYFFNDVDYTNVESIPKNALQILDVLKGLENLSPASMTDAVTERLPDIKKSEIFQTVRYAVAGGVPGVGVPVILSLVGDDAVRRRVGNAIDYIQSRQ